MVNWKQYEENQRIARDGQERLRRERINKSTEYIAERLHMHRQREKKMFESVQQGFMESLRAEFEKRKPIGKPGTEEFGVECGFCRYKFKLVIEGGAGGKVPHIAVCPHCKQHNGDATTYEMHVDPAMERG